MTSLCHTPIVEGDKKVPNDATGRRRSPCRCKQMKHLLPQCGGAIWKLPLEWRYMSSERKPFACPGHVGQSGHWPPDVDFMIFHGKNKQWHFRQVDPNDLVSWVSWLLMIFWINKTGSQCMSFYPTFWGITDLISVIFRISDLSCLASDVLCPLIVA
jgi:hypothetical protein